MIAQMKATIFQLCFYLKNYFTSVHLFQFTDVNFKPDNNSFVRPTTKFPI